MRERFSLETIDAVYSSDLSRAIATARAISETHGLPINATECLREVNVGEWEDAAWGDIRFHQPEMNVYFNSDPARWRVSGSEEYGNVRRRMFDCVSDIAKRHDGRAVAVFSHGFAIRALTCELLGLPSNKTDMVPYCDNSAVALLRYDSGRFEVEYHCDNSHLPCGSSTFESQTWWRDEKERKRENLRYVPFDEKRDADIFGSFSREMCSRPSGVIDFLVVLEDEPAGLLGLDVRRDSGDGVGWVSQFFLKPEFDDMEFEIQLLGQAVSEYRKLRREKLRIEADEQGPLMNFCSKYEFAKIGESGTLCVMEKFIRNW